MNKISSPVIFGLVGAATLLCIYLFFMMTTQPKQEEITSLEADLQTKQSTLSQYQANAAALPGLRNNVNQLERESGEFLKALPLKANFSKLIAKIRSTVSNNGAELKSITISNGSSANLPAGVRPMSVNLSIEGDYAQQFQILRALETQGRFTNISQMTVNTANTGNTDDVIINNPKLSNALQIMVYTFDPALAAPPNTSEATPADGAPAAAPQTGGN